MPILPITIEKRPEPRRWLTLAVLASSLVLALFTVAFVFWGYGANPLDVYSAIFIGSFGSVFGWSWTIVKAIPLLLCGVGLAVAFKALFWNIGAEGQLLMGAVGASGIALYVLPDAPPIALVPTMFAAGFLCGAAWGLIPAILKAKLKANEVITTLMMNYIASYFVNYLVIWPGPWNGPGEYSFPYSSIFAPSAWLPNIPGTSIHYPTLVLGLALAVFMYVLVRRTKLGYEIRV
ncbi:MAG: ABC transporter permease, partial [Aigarchaeota archaeon]|nr:ABC transporter permease [Aigarchaeota archaeon]